MPILKNVSKFFAVLAIAVVPCAYSICCSAAASEPVVVVEQIISGRDIVGYRLVQPTKADKMNSVLLSTLNGPTSLIQCEGGRVIYLDSEGMIKEFVVRDKTTTDLWQTDIDLISEDLTGKLLFRNEDQILYAAINTYPDEVKVNRNMYVLKAFPKEGASRTLVSGNGKVYALWQPSENVVELITNEGLIQYDHGTGKVVPITPVNSAGLSNLALFRQGHSFYSRQTNLEVRQGLFGSSLLRRRFNDGFELAVDVSSRSNIFLTIKMSSVPSTGNQLVETNLNTGEDRIIFESESIRGACYL